MWHTAADINKDLRVATKAAAYVQSRGQVPCSWAPQQQFSFILRKNMILVSVVHIYPLSLFLITQFIWIFGFHNAANWYKSPPLKLSVHNVFFFYSLLFSSFKEKQRCLSQIYFKLWTKHLTFAAKLEQAIANLPMRISLCNWFYYIFAWLRKLAHLFFWNDALIFSQWVKKN